MTRNPPTLRDFLPLPLVALALVGTCIFAYWGLTSHNLWLLSSAICLIGFREVVAKHFTSRR